MKRDDILHMAREAGLANEGGSVEFNNPVGLERFAALVAAAEREACARMFEEDSTLDGQDRWELAELIRARGEE